MNALLIVDLQNDFMPQGPLGVPGADQLAPLINQLMPHFPLVVASQDWHPQNHVSFATNHQNKAMGAQINTPYGPQILWPDHCIQQTSGSALVEGLDSSAIARCIHKGIDSDIDSYSAFFDNARVHSTGLADFLKAHGVTTLFFTGVATEYCVLYSALDALDLGFQVVMITDAIREICPSAATVAIDRIIAAGGRQISSSILLVS